MYHHHPEGTYPIKIQWEISSHEKLEQEAKQRYEKTFNNQTVNDDLTDIINIPFDRTQEFIRRYNELIQEFNTF